MSISGHYHGRRFCTRPCQVDRPPSDVHTLAVEALDLLGPTVHYEGCSYARARWTCDCNADADVGEVRNRLERIRDIAAGVDKAPTDKDGRS